LTAFSAVDIRIARYKIHSKSVAKRKMYEMFKGGLIKTKHCNRKFGMQIIVQNITYCRFKYLKVYKPLIDMASGDILVFAS